MLITRASFAGDTARAVQARGFTPVLAPLLTIEHCTIQAAEGVQAILVTSGNALPSLPPSSTPLFAVGDATARRASQLGFADVRSAAGDAVALSCRVAGALAPVAGPLLLVSGEGLGRALAADLRSRGFAVIHRTGYTARPVAVFPQAAAAALRARGLHAALFLSAATAAVFVRLLPPAFIPLLRHVAALAISPSTARVLEPLPWLRVCPAPTPTLDDVLAQL